jgi:protein gp37
MAENSKIEWTDHTFNPWIGCQKVSPGCDHCYAETLSKRYGWVTWGPHGARKRTSDANWRKPRQWAKAARASGIRLRVFCASLADVFDNQVPDLWRGDLFDLIAATPELDWLLLTKRPENLARMFPTGWWGNVWLGTTAEDQKHFDRRYPLIREARVPVHFISYEPALGPLSYLWGKPEWLICGGESGPGARTMDPAWAREIRDQCAASGVAFFMKQMTGKAPIPADLMVRQFPEPRHAVAA